MTIPFVDAASDTKRGQSDHAKFWVGAGCTDISDMEVILRLAGSCGACCGEYSVRSTPKAVRQSRLHANTRIWLQRPDQDFARALVCMSRLLQVKVDVETCANVQHPEEGHLQCAVEDFRRMSVAHVTFAFVYLPLQEPGRPQGGQATVATD